MMIQAENIRVEGALEYCANAVYGRHHGQFKYWPQVHEMWRTRTYGTKVIRTIDFEEPQWDQRASSFEMRRFCGRR